MLQGLKALVVGVSNDRSIGAAVARSLKEMAVKYFSLIRTMLKSRVEKVAASLQIPLDSVYECDVTNDSHLDHLVDNVSQQHGNIDIIIHSVAYAPRESINGDYLESLSKESFTLSHEVSSYSLAALCKKFHIMNEGASILTMSYLGSERAMQNYNVMGLAKASLEANVRYLAYTGKRQIRVNALSPGPIRTLAASGIGNFKRCWITNAKNNPLGRNVTTKEVGDVVAFICSPLASGITAQTIYVDCGFNKCEGVAE